MSIQDVQRYVEQHTRAVAVGTEGSQSVGFFGVVLHEEPTPADLQALISENELGGFDVRMTPDLWRAGPHYIQLGGWIGDQGLALRLIGLGGLLGMWKVLLPDVLGISEGEEQYQTLLGQGFVYALPTSLQNEFAEEIK